MNNLAYFIAGVIWGLNILLAPIALDKEFKSKELTIRALIEMRSDR